MRSDRESVVGVLDRLDAVTDDLLDLSCAELTVPELMRVALRLERVARRLPAAQHAVLNLLAEQADPAQLGGRLPSVLANRLHITRAEANRRLAEAADLGERHTLTGQTLAPYLTATAQAQRAGRIGDGHVRVIRDFVKHLPAHVDVETQEKAEEHLAQLAAQYRPDQLAKLAQRLMDCLHPDGDYTDDDRARRRGLSLGKQDVDGMSRLTGYLTPEARATLEAVLAKLAAPGMCNPDDDTPCVAGAPSEDAVRHDLRSTAQRNHDGMLAACRALLCSGELGQHNGLPASIIVTTTLNDLEAAAGTGLTGGGTLLPMSDVIRLSRHAHHYLAIFDRGNALALYHTKRLASPAQRIVLYAKDRGCTAPGCDVTGYYCEVHHVTPYAQSRTTDINQLALACGGHHPLAEQGYTTRTNTRGDTEWIPPPHLDHGQPRTNTYHHPEKLLSDGDDEDAA
ncbi:HNH endonuclease [Mycobacterium kubicae]|uniref:HNH endonuclease signature motif containing protein n=1 Tax=Mycobacterium kubicae TaxID=120959 RepID=UPI001640B732|nr:HNH endonuclease signature motif containing protein [Mycobacterium kubicae]QNI08668.1 HNH endonuclease [Mycobacterium kubicae]